MMEKITEKFFRFLAGFLLCVMAFYISMAVGKLIFVVINLIYVLWYRPIFMGNVL